MKLFVSVFRVSREIEILADVCTPNYYRIEKKKKMILLTLASIIFNAPVLTGLLSIVFFASIGISLGVRRAYIKVLLKIFEVRIFSKYLQFTISFFFSFKYSIVFVVSASKCVFDA